MRGRILFVVGLAAGYVLGAKAGRGRYEDIKRVASRLWENPRVQRQVKNVEGRAVDFAKEKAPEVVDFLSDGAKKVVSKVGRSSPGKTPADRSAAAASPASAKTASGK
jgi:hypothetical protein